MADNGNGVTQPDFEFRYFETFLHSLPRAYIHKPAYIVAVIYWLSMINFQNIFIVCKHFSPIFTYKRCTAQREREKERRYSIRANIFLCERLVRRAISKYRPKCRANHDKQIYWDIWMEMRLMSYIEFGGKVFFSLLIHFTSHEAKQKEKKIYSKIYFAPKSLWLCFRSCIWADGWWWFSVFSVRLFDMYKQPLFGNFVVVRFIYSWKKGKWLM